MTGLQIPESLNVKSLQIRARQHLLRLGPKQRIPLLQYFDIEFPDSLDPKDIDVNEFFDDDASPPGPSKQKQVLDIQACAHISLVYFLTAPNVEWTFAKLHDTSSPLLVSTLQARKLTETLYNQLFPLTMAFIRVGFGPDMTVCYVVIQPFRIGVGKGSRALSDPSSSDPDPILVDGPPLFFALHSQAYAIAHNHIPDKTLLDGCLMALERSLSIVQKSFVSIDLDNDPGIPFRSFAAASGYVKARPSSLQGGIWSRYTNNTADMNALALPAHDTEPSSQPMSERNALARYKFTGSALVDFVPQTVTNAVERSIKYPFGSSDVSPKITIRIEGSNVFQGLFDMNVDGVYIPDPSKFPPWLTDQRNVVSIE